MRKARTRQKSAHPQTVQVRCASRNDQRPQNEASQTTYFNGLLEARYRSGDGWDGLTKDDIQRAKERADDAYEQAEPERRIRDEARQQLNAEKAGEARLKKELSTALKAYKTAADRVSKSAKDLETALASARKAVGPEEEARLKQADTLATTLSKEGLALEKAESAHLELVQKRERLVHSRVKAQKVVDQIKKDQEAGDGSDVSSAIAALLEIIDSAKKTTAAEVSVDALETALANAEKAVATERSSIRKLPRTYTDALRTVANSLPKLSRLVGQLRSDLKE